MAPKHLAQIITVLLSQPEPFKSLSSTSRHVKRPSLDLLTFHDAAENSAIAVAMLCFSQLQRQMFAPRGFVSSKLGKQNARWTLNKSLLLYREPHQNNCTPFKHPKYNSWSGSSNVRSTGSISARPFWVEDINSAKDLARGLWQFSLTMAIVISRMFPSQLHLHGTTMYYTCIGWGKATSKSFNYPWFRPAANGRLRKWSCYCCAWLQIITNRNGWHGCCQWQSHGIGATTAQRLAILENAGTMPLALVKKKRRHEVRLYHDLSLKRVTQSPQYNIIPLKNLNFFKLTESVCQCTMIGPDKAGLQWHWQHQCFALQQIPTFLLSTSRVQSTFLCKTFPLKVWLGTWHLPSLANGTHSLLLGALWRAGAGGTCGGWSLQAWRKRKTAHGLCQMGWRRGQHLGSFLDKELFLLRWQLWHASSWSLVWHHHLRLLATASPKRSCACVSLS